MSNDALILDLSARLDPVRRRSARREAALLLALGAIELALFLGLGLMRPDMGRMIGSPYMLWKLGGLAGFVLLSGATALRSFSPPASPRRGLGLAIGFAGAAMVAGLPLGSSFANDTLWERLSPVHGLLCSLCIVILSLPMMGMMAVLLRRGAPAHPGGSALAAGLAAGGWGALVFAFCCPANDPLYVVTWYFAGCAAVAALARWILPRGFRL
ncbi:NrsF family protein [Flavisphingomonas formosensis]|uniref:NrsF family protein n=1 Tax=Flavisphingomonas formosensis TaxID=861534 RepID=UPI0012FC20C7|nr:NrsF family protein [Sphingomonas formosensis]